MYAPQSGIHAANDTDKNRNTAGRGFPATPTNQQRRLSAPPEEGAPQRAMTPAFSECRLVPDTARTVNRTSDRLSTRARHCHLPFFQPFHRAPAALPRTSDPNETTIVAQLIINDKCEKYRNTSGSSTKRGIVVQEAKTEHTKNRAQPKID